jgi:hypothetical protein
MTDKRPQTIQFFLPQGEPRGIRIADITTRIVQAVLVPRSKLPEAAKRDELRSVGVYFLFGEPEDAAKPVVYIGETEDCYGRFLEHNRKLDFWQSAVAIVSKTNSFTKAHAKYLEWHCIKVAKEVGRFHLSNGNAGGEPFVTEPMLADLMDAFDTLNVLTSALGFPLFEARPQATGADVFVLSGKDCEGQGQLVEDGFTVFAGSKARKQMVPSAEKWLQASRQELLASGVLVDDGTHLVFKEDHTFKTPSGAAMTVLGRTANGWKEWKSKFGGTLDELKRQSAETDNEESTDDSLG